MNPTFFLFIIMMIIFQLSSSSGQTLIPSTCKAVSRSDPNINYSFCTTALQAAPASQCANLRGLAMISIRLIRYNITDTRCQVKQWLKKGKFDPYVRQCLNDCFDLFSDAIPSVKQAMKSFNNQSFDDANVQISSIMEASTTCEQGFTDRAGVVSPLTKRNRDLFQLSAIALSLMRLIHNNSAGSS